MNLDFILLLIFKSLRSYNKRLLTKFITYYLLLIINIASYKEKSYFILISPFNIYNIILNKSWINKYNVFLNIIKNKILFVLKRCNYRENFKFIFKDLIFLTLFNYVLSGINIYLLLYIFRKVLLIFFLNYLNL